MTISDLRIHLLAGQVIPAMPLALNEDGSWSQQHQRALVRYYLDAGVGGVAVGVHTTQFEIRKPEHDLLESILRFCSEKQDQWLGEKPRRVAKIAGICGDTDQALREANLAVECGYHAGLLSMSAMSEESEDRLIEHCRAVAEIIPLFGFYLQPKIGGGMYPYSFWRRFAEIENVVAIKIAPFDRYATFEVVRAVIDAGRDDIALYTGNDDNIINDLLTVFNFSGSKRHISGGLLGQWAVWTKAAVDTLEEIKLMKARNPKQIESWWLTRNTELTDANGALFDAANEFAGSIPGIHEVLRRQGLLPSIRCLDPEETLSPGQKEEIDRVLEAYSFLEDDEFVRNNLDRWMND
ncbi:MAG: dihydrodipicolinate synthase family protein [Verrucomicrobiales bacterium]|nr:dihydrodipicolinate synthase family protein [Verrucomicrobiales bacterium]